MKFPLLLGLALVIGLSSARALPPPEQAPSPAPSATASPKPFAFPIPSAARTRAPDVNRALPFSVPAPQPTRVVPPPPIPPYLPNASGPPDSTQALKAIPRVEVWRSGAKASQATRRRGRQLGRGFIAGHEPVMVQLLFDPSQAGKTVFVTSGPGLTVEPPTAFLRIRPTGDCALTVKLDESFHEELMTFSCEGVTSLLRLSHAPLSLVTSLEMSTQEGGR